MVIDFTYTDGIINDRHIVYSYFKEDKMRNKFLFVDAETDGLYGTFLSIAVILTGYEGNEIERYYWGINPKTLQIQSEWVMQNVVPIMGDYEICRNEDELLEKFWNVWDKNRENTFAVADVCYPVESTLFQRCVLHDLEERQMKGPFPLLDLSSMLLAKGIDPLVDRLELSDENGKKMHNALTGVEIYVEIWRKVCQK